MHGMRTDAKHLRHVRPHSQVCSRNQIVKALPLPAGGQLLLSASADPNIMALTCAQLQGAPAARCADPGKCRRLVPSRPTCTICHARLIQSVAQPDASMHKEVPRRSLLLGAIPLVAATQLPVAHADEAVTQAANQTVFLDVKLEGKPLGRIAVELFTDVAIGSARFKDLAVGKQGVGYRLSRFDGIFPTYIRCEGVKSLSYSADMQIAIAGGDNLSLLEKELDQQTRHHDSAGLVSLIVRESEERPVKERLIARDGKLVTVSTQFGEAPNATTFTITRGADSALDATNLIVGRVIGGSEVVDAIAALPFARPRDSAYDGPFFAAAKAMGDRRADVAEKGFNRPLKRVIVTNGGLL